MTLITQALSTESDAPRENNSENASSPQPESLCCVALQPILDMRSKVFGYELLFRSSPTSMAFDGDGNNATRTVIDNSLILGWERLTNGLPMFVNCTYEALMGGLVHLLPPNQTVLEVLETLEPTRELVEACRALKAKGFRLALDDFQGKAGWHPLVTIADFVKIDLSQTTAQERMELRHKVGRHKAKLVMERIETREDWARAKAEGFTLFQGFYFCRPILMKGKGIPANRMVHIEILQAVLESPLHVKHVSTLVKRDPSLTYRVLRVANSPLFATNKAVTSIESALVRIGDEMFRRLAIVATVGALSARKPVELLRMSLVRARFCELAAQSTGQDATEPYLLGMLSLMPAMLDVPMESIAPALPLREETRKALLGETNEEGKLLHWLAHHERAEWQEREEISRVMGIGEGTLGRINLDRIYQEAMNWAEAMVKVVTS
ncbi:EAL and HDOD domain-containing protein [Acidicapsa dinghuensis]|uniref:EAL and HDOD domain-containing protein n=1 Tax=Acidicapsa dinghuensis TaxID=2218256 RepID=A0ABW1EHV9_9BACT|nr:HDOD domain-containing protein [Acidicapsa dinghuensis]